MEIQTFKNDYGYEKVKCPFCAKEISLRKATKVSPDRLRDLKKHITNQAKNEAIKHFLAEEVKLELPHLEYYEAHTKAKVIQVSEKREFDSDLQIVG